MGREAVIEQAILDQPSALGFGGALGIRNCRFAQRSGRIDLILLPPVGPVELVLVEAKSVHSPDAASKVVGQLIMYYAGALNFLGSTGLTMLREYAETHRDQARDPHVTMPKMIAGKQLRSVQAFDAIRAGTQLQPSAVRLFVAIDNEPHRSLRPVLYTLHLHHHLDIGLVIVKDGAISRVEQPSAA